MLCYGAFYFTNISVIFSFHVDMALHTSFTISRYYFKFNDPLKQRHLCQKHIVL
jgi:hypothetical protein